MPDISVSGPDGTFMAYAALPGGTGKGPGVLVAQEIFGVNETMRAICDDLAGEGYVALCPDLFWRQQPGIQITDQQMEKAFALYQGFDEAKGVEDLRAALAALRAHPRCNGKVGTVGYCLGGKLAYLMATRSDADCNAGYYGVGIEAALGEAASISKPLLLHIAEKDGFCPPAAQAKITSTLAGNALVTVHSYPGCDHAFARVGGGHFDAAAAGQANGRTADFFRRHLTR